MGIIYSVSELGHEIRGVVVFVALPKRTVRPDRMIGCVRFLANLSELSGKALDPEDVIVRCSCSEWQLNGCCVHIEYFGNILHVVHPILCMPIQVYRSVCNESWRVFLVGPTENTTYTIWVAVGCGDARAVENSFVPVIESRDQKHMYMSISQRLRCMNCRRSAVNRGLCEHEYAVCMQVSRRNKSKPLDLNNLSNVIGESEEHRYAME